MSKISATKQATLRCSNPVLLTLLGFTQFLLVASLGCRSTSDNQIDLLERELRTQEDYIYELESYVVEYSEKLRDTRCAYPQQAAVYAQESQEPELAPQRATKKPPRRSEKDELQLESNKDDLPAPAARRRSPEITPQKATPESEVSPEEMEVPDEIELEIEPPLSEMQESRPLRQVAAVGLPLESSDDDLLLIPDPLDFGSSLPPADFDDSETAAMASENEHLAEQLFDDQQVEETVALVEREVDHLQVTQLFHSEGDEQPSLLTVVEALDANGEPVDLDGEVSLMVMTAGEETPRRLKRWNFTSQETVDAWQSSDLGDGLHLELPLEKLQLPATPLELWVRLVTSEGRKLLTQLPFDSHHLSSIATASTEQPPSGLSLATVAAPAEVAHLASTTPPASAKPPVPSLLESPSTPQSEERQLVESHTPPNQAPNQTRWRASMRRTDPTATGFAATSQENRGWTTQSPGRQLQRPQPPVPVRVARRNLPPRSNLAAAQPAPQPVWTSGRTEPPVAASQTPTASGNTPASWSISR